MISHSAMAFVLPQLIYTQRPAGMISQPLRCAASDEMNGPVADCSPRIACGWANDGVQSRWGSQAVGGWSVRRRYKLG